MKLAISVAAIGVSLTATAISFAQPPETYTYPVGEAPQGNRLEAPKDAFELSVATGYTQGFGNLRSGVGMPSVATPGIGVDLGLGYRIDPNWGISLAGQYQELTAQRSDAARGITASIAAQYHFAPTMRTDPWMELGAGYRVLWENPNVGPTVTTHGIQVARARVGLDFRLDKAVSIGPVIGGDLDLFLFQDLPNVQTNINDPRLSMFVYGGLQGRFDMGGTTTMNTQSIAKR